MTHPTDAELEAMAAKLEGSGCLNQIFDAAAMLRACKGKEKPMRCAECNCENGGADCTWIKTPDPWHTIDNTSVAKGNEMTNLTTPEHVGRYAPDGDFSGGVWMTESPDGEYVRHSDYAALSAKLEAAEARERALLQSNEQERKALVENTSLRDRLKAAEAERDAAIIALGECMREIDDYIRQEYPGDHPVHERYRQRDFSANPAREFLQARPASYVAARQKGGAI